MEGDMRDCLKKEEKATQGVDIKGMQGSLKQQLDNSCKSRGATAIKREKSERTPPVRVFC